VNRGPLTPRSPVLITFAVPEEARPFQALLPQDWPVTSLLTGIGAQAARKTLSAVLQRTQPSLVLTAGFAGGLHPQLRTGDIVFDAATTPSLARHLMTKGTPAAFLTVDHVVASVAEKRTLRLSSGADAVEMESGTIRALCLEAGIPCATVRVISDAADEALPLDFGQCLSPTGRLRPGRILLRCVRQPSLIPALLRLRSVTRQAANRLATILMQLPEPWWAATASGSSPVA